MSSLRVVHYLNQFFAGIGGEDQANLPVQIRDGAIGPGRLLQ
ncbi:MAG TPA: glycine/sarcosine/betaine reductase selenoprotein B family protein, partial [Chloroflexota bacterium]|nr:glycine/sarcosine/betaine reductase selenoprotein B family protein [Chloroflexota bacterium]